MERKILEFDIDTKDGLQRVEISRVYNYVYDAHAKMVERILEISDVLQEKAEIKKDRGVLIDESAAIIATFKGNITIPALKEAREQIAPIKDEISECDKKIKELDKKLRDMDKAYRLENYIGIIIDVLKDNGVTGDLLDPKYWDRCVTHGEGTRLLNAIMTKDTDSKKKE